MTTARIFNEHFIILRELRNKMNLLKQAYYGQQDKKKTWEQVDEIISVLNTGCNYLDFPIEKEVSKYFVANELEHIEEGDEVSEISKSVTNKSVSISVDQ